MATNHLSATYTDCNHRRLTDRSSLIEIFKKAVGVENTEASELIFANGGLTATMTMTAGRASLHTYPEQNACFVDLFTQDIESEVSRLDGAFRRYLAPLHASHKVVILNRNVR